jgi:hypothetical protein
MNQLCVRRSKDPAFTTDDGKTWGPWDVEKVFKDGQFYAQRSKDEAHPDSIGTFSYAAVLDGKTYFMIGEEVMGEAPVGQPLPVVPKGSDVYLQVQAILKEIDWDNLPVCAD